MKGHAEIIKMRLRGRRPAKVFINDYPCDEELDWHRHGDHATVCIHGDAIEALDFRFLVGVEVHIGSLDADRTRRMYERVKNAGAQAVVSGHIVPGGVLYVKTETLEICHEAQGHG